MSHDSHYTATPLLLILLNLVVLGLENALRSFFTQWEPLGAELFSTRCAVILCKALRTYVIIRHTTEWPINDST